MNSAPLTIWCNAHFPQPALDELRGRLGAHRLVFPAGLQKSNLVAGGPDPLLAEADVAFGQPDPAQAMELPRLKWVQLTSAGYTRYDRDDLRAAFARRAAVMTNSSDVYAEPCAEHLFGMMLALARQIPQCAVDQREHRSWRAAEHREKCRLLVGQSVLILGFGTIAARLVELLQPFHMRLTATRRHPTPAEGCEVIAADRTDEWLPTADHVVNILPASPATERFLDRRRLGLMKPRAILYNIGRGSTVDQTALAEALNAGGASRGLSGRDRPRAAAAGASTLESRQLPYHAPYGRRP